MNWAESRIHTLSAWGGCDIIQASYEKEKGKRMRKWTTAGCLLWIIGLAAFIIGLNLTGSSKEWLTVIGSIAFLAGLGIIGAIRLKNKNDQQDNGNKNTADQS